jgi:1,4-dihydroxy-2-naphthoate octaprenyltransferase
MKPFVVGYVVGLQLAYILYLRLGLQFDRLSVGITMIALCFTHIMLVIISDYCDYVAALDREQIESIKKDIDQKNEESEELILEKELALKWALSMDRQSVENRECNDLRSVPPKEEVIV